MAGLTKTLLLLHFLAAICVATPVISSTSRGGTSATDTGSAISGRAPLGVVIDAGSGTTGGTVYDKAVCTEPGAVAIRIRESQITTVTYEDGAKTLIETDAFSLLSWEKLDLQNWDITAGWTASGADALALYDNGTGLHGKPIAIKLNNDVIQEGTIGSLSNEQWAWGDVDTIGSNRVYVQSAAVTPTIHAIYGDGTHIIIPSGTGVTPGCFEVSTKDSDDQLTMVDAVCVGDPTDIVIGQAVNAFTDLRYNWSVSCTGGVCVEDITNGDQRPGLSTTAIDETVGRGPIWAYVFAEGFGVATITLTVTDDCNGGTDTQTITVTETAWTGATVYYADFTDGLDANDGLTTGTAFKTYTACVNAARTVAGGTAKKCLLQKGETFTETVRPTTWVSETDDFLLSYYGSGATPEVSTSGSAGAGLGMQFTSTGPSSNIRIKGINFTHAAGAASRCLAIDATNSVLMDCSVTQLGSEYVMTAGYNDYIIWNVDVFVDSPAAASYGLFDSGPTAASLKRRAIVGCDMYTDTSQMCIRTYSTNSIIAYNKLTTESSAGAPAIRFAGANGISQDYNALVGNYLISGAVSVGTGVQFFVDDATADDHKYTVIDGNFILAQHTAASTSSGINVAMCSKDLLVRNNVFVGHDIDVSSNTGASEIRFYNNSVYATKTGTEAHLILKSGASASARNFKFINNAAYVPNSDTGSVIVQNTGSFGTIESTSIIENIVYFGTVSNAYQVEAASGGFTAGGWPTVSMKAAQLNYTASQGKDNDPRFALPASNDFRLCTASGVPDATCSGASPCIDAGYDLPTVYYDFSGTARNSDDVGAWDDDSSGAAMAGAPIGSMMLLGVGP